MGNKSKGGGGSGSASGNPSQEMSGELYSNDEASFFDYDNEQIGRFAEHLEYENRMDRFSELDEQNSDFDENGDIIDEELTVPDWYDAVNDYFRENRWNTMYGEGDIVPPTLGMKVIDEMITGSLHLDEYGVPATERIERYGVNAKEYMDDFMDNYISQFDRYVYFDTDYRFLSSQNDF